MTALRIVAAHVLTLCAGGCAIDASQPSVAVTTTRPASISPERSKDAVVAGRSTKADVMRALGQTLAIRFDSGYEVWVYRLSGSALSGVLPRVLSDKSWPPAPAELVILFAPSGVVAKSRIRPAG